MELLNDMVMLLVTVALTTVAVAAFLRLAGFPWGGPPKSPLFVHLMIGNVMTVIALWLVSSMFGLLFYLSLGVRFGIRGPLALFVVFAATGILMMGIKIAEPTNLNFRAWVLYVAWLYVWATVAVGWRAGWVGLLLVTIPALLIAGGWMFFIADFLLPSLTEDLPEEYRQHKPGALPTFQDEVRDFFAMFRSPEGKQVRQQAMEQNRKALRCLISYALGSNYNYYTVIDEKIAERTDEGSAWLPPKEKLIKRLKGDPYANALAGPGIALTGCDQAVVVSSGQKLKGIRSGVVFTDAADDVTDVIDLRVQLRAFPVEAWTKDGIAVKVVTFIPFKINAGEEKPALGKGFPFRVSEAFKAIVSEQVQVDDSQKPKEGDLLKWFDLPQLAGERILRDVLSRYSFDELYAPLDLRAPSDDPRVQIAAELRRRLDQELPKWGIQRVGGGISNIMPVDQRVIEQRIEAWKADWTRKILLQRAAGQWKRLNFVEQARAQAQVDVIMNIGQQIERLRASGGANFVTAFARHFLELLNDLTERPGARKLLPQDTDDILRGAREIYEREAEGQILGG